jgi:hypothetical protein
MNPLAFGAANHVTDTITDNAAITMALNNIANAATNNSNLIAALNESVKALEMQARQQRQPPGTTTMKPQSQVLFHLFLAPIRGLKHLPSLISMDTTIPTDGEFMPPTPVPRARRKSEDIRMRPRGQIQWEEATNTRDGRQTQTLCDGEGRILLVMKLVLK